jgi:heme A synthase
LSVKPPESSATVRLAPRWLHVWALLTVAATAGLLALGSVVTTFRVGMADPVWPTAPWYLFFISWREPSPGFLIEHSHRLAGYVVGCCVIVLAAGLVLSASRTWLRVLGAVALLAVIAQGVLGGFRVRLNALVGTDLAALHGLFAQVVFSLLVALALFTSRRFVAPGLSPEEGRKLGRLSLLLAGLVFLQLVWGALVRHTSGSLSTRAHLLTAFAVVAVAAVLARAAFDSPAGRRVLGVPLAVLAILLTLQLLLGVEAWLGKFAGALLPEAQAPTYAQAAVRTAHLLVGSWVLACAVVIALLAHRRASAVPARGQDSLPEPVARLRPANGAVSAPEAVLSASHAHQPEGTA